MIKVALRCDASPEIGGGHVMRCLALAEALAAKGAGILFLARQGSSEAAPGLFRAGDVRMIEGSAASALAAIGTHWPSGADLAVVDSYAIDEAYERALRAQTRKIMVIDDLATRRHDCDLLLDQTCGRRDAEYAELVPASARLLVGSGYAVLRGEFAALREEAVARRGRIAAERILVAMGLTDVGGVTLPVAQAALAAFPAGRFDVVLGARASSVAPLEALARSEERLRIHVDAKDLARLMLEADFGIGALGTMTWERCCLGLPSIGIVLADNQRDIADEVVKAEAALVIRDVRDVAALLPEMLRRLGADAGLRARLARNALSLVDGLGARRVAEAVFDTASH